MLFVVALATAGCISGQENQGPASEDEAVSTTGSTSADPSASTDGQALEAPTWQVGDWWTWRSDQAGEFSYVVTGDEGQDWIVGTDSEQIAFFHARTEVSFLGEIRKSDLAGSQNDTRVQYFDWPLVEDKTWSTTWDGVQRTITVVDIEDGLATLEAREGDRLAVSYVYDSQTGWFGEITFHAPDGSAAFTTTPVASGSNFTGEVVEWRFDAQVGASGTLQPAAVPAGVSFTVPGNATDIWLDLQVECPSGAFNIGFSSEQGQGWGITEVCPYNETTTGAVIEDPEPGQWDGGVIAASPAEQGTYSFEIIVRTLETVPIGA